MDPREYGWDQRADTNYLARVELWRHPATNIQVGRLCLLVQRHVALPPPLWYCSPLKLGLTMTACALELISSRVGHRLRVHELVPPPPTAPPPPAPKPTNPKPSTQVDYYFTTGKAKVVEKRSKFQVGGGPRAAQAGSD